MVPLCKSVIFSHIIPSYVRETMDYTDNLIDL